MSGRFEHNVCLDQFTFRGEFYDGAHHSRLAVTCTIPERLRYELGPYGRGHQVDFQALFSLERENYLLGRSQLDYALALASHAAVELREAVAMTATEIRAREQARIVASIDASQDERLGIALRELGPAMDEELMRAFFGTLAEAHQRGLELLKSWLTPDQLKQYEAHDHFDVIGNMTGKRYRINYGCQMNVVELDRRGREVRGLCFVPQGGLVAGDVMLGQKIMLENDEPAAIAVAHPFGVYDGDFDHLRPGAVNYLGSPRDSPGWTQRLYEAGFRAIRSTRAIVNMDGV